MARLSPTLKTIKRLFARSNNKCAFPKCKEAIVDDSGTVIGHICHIEAANKLGARYNPDSNDEDRRDFSNLLLMCPTHHKTIDDNPAEYPVANLREFKHNIESSSDEDLILDDIQAEELISQISIKYQQNVDVKGDGAYIIQADTVNINPGAKETEEKFTPKLVPKILILIIVLGLAFFVGIKIKNHYKEKDINEKVKLLFALQDQELVTESQIVEIAVAVIADVAGVNPNFKVKSEENFHNLAILIDSTDARMLIFGPRFMNELKEKSNSYWPAVMATAHEMGRLINGVMYDSNGEVNHHKMYNEAGYFAGFVLGESTLII